MLNLIYAFILTILFIIIIFLTLKELTGVSSFWDIFNFNFLKNLK